MRLSESVWLRRAGLLGAAVVLLAVNLVFFVWYRATARDRQLGLENRRVQLEKDVVPAEAEVAMLSGQRERLSQVSSAIKEFYENRVGPRRETLAPLVEELHMVLWRLGLSPSQISYATAPVPDLPLTQMSISFAFRSDYGKFKQLLAALESERRWIVVREVGLSRDADVPGGVQVHMKLAIYFAGEGKSQPQSPMTAVAKRQPE